LGHGISLLLTLWSQLPLCHRISLILPLLYYLLRHGIGITRTNGSRWGVDRRLPIRRHTLLDLRGKGHRWGDIHLLRWRNALLVQVPYIRQKVGNILLITTIGGRLG